MKISDVRNILKEEQYLLDKNIDIKSVVSGRKYEFVYIKGHIFQSLPTNAISKDIGVIGWSITNAKNADVPMFMQNQVVEESGFIATIVTHGFAGLHTQRCATFIRRKMSLNLMIRLHLKRFSNAAE